jgi:hypothetical protein
MRLVIDYILDGQDRGYRFITPTDHLNPEIVRTIWRNAMPRGQGWGTAVYVGARSLKCIPLDLYRVAVSDVTVTGRRDELGRQGLRRAEITLMTTAEYADYLEALWAQQPVALREYAERRFGMRLWRRLADAALPRMSTASQIVLTYPYTGVESWRVVEACVLKLALTQRARPQDLPVTPFTTLALDYRDESSVVALPLEKAGEIKAAKGVSVIDLS